MQEGEEGMISWKFGEVDGPDGKVREIPQKHVWASTVWITRSGVARRRFFDISRRTWRWEEEAIKPTVDGEGRMLLHLAESYVPIQTAIALAWLKRAPGSHAKTSLTEGKRLHAKYIRWEKPEKEEEPSLEGEAWQKLTWQIGAVRCDDSFFISTHGRLRAPSGECTLGFWFDGRRWAAVPECGLVDLTSASGKLRKNPNYLPPAVKMAHDCLVLGYSISDLKRAAGVKATTAIKNMRLAAEHIDQKTLRRVVPNLVSIDMWTVVHRMFSEKDPLLGGKLTDLHQAVKESLSSRGQFARSEDPVGELALARMCFARED